MSIAADVSNQDRLPSLPIVVARLVSLYATDHYTLDEVVAALETDPPISARVLRLANSAYYGFAGTIDSLRRAVALLGGTTVQAVALGATLLRSRSGTALPPEAEELWIHAFLSGIGCRRLALRLPKQPHRSEPDALFLTGLLHDVGKIHFLADDPVAYAEDLEQAQSGEDLRSRECRRFGRDHAEAAGEILENWNLPPWLTQVVRYHHRSQLRAEFRLDWEVLRAVQSAFSEECTEAASGDVPSALIDDLRSFLARARPEAEAIYKAVS